MFYLRQFQIDICIIVVLIVGLSSCQFSGGLLVSGQMASGQRPVSGQVVSGRVVKLSGGQYSVGQDVK